MKIRFVIADDHVLFRQGLVSLLAKRPEWQVVGEAGDGEQALCLCEELQPDIVFLDIEMPGMSGIEAAEKIRVVSPDTRIIALSMYRDKHYQRRMFEAGAVAYVLKNEAVDDLICAVDATAAGERFISPAAISQVRETIPSRSADVDKERLSKRELEVIRLLAEGLRTKEIAEVLGISAKTVETYRSRIMLKLDIDNLAGLVRFAIRSGIILPNT
jgi:DNA-binding NarL/FixJ family response regulator